MEIDLRNSNNTDDGAIELRFSYSDTIREFNDELILLEDDFCGEGYTLFKKDIDCLIKALQKAKELWGDGE